MGERRQKRGGKGVGEHKVRTETLPRYRAFLGGGEERMEPSQCDIKPQTSYTC